MHHDNLMQIKHHLLSYSNIRHSVFKYSVLCYVKAPKTGITNESHVLVTSICIIMNSFNMSQVNATDFIISTG